MRSFHAVALALSLVATVGAASAKAPKPAKPRPATAASKKVAASPAPARRPTKLARTAPAPAPLPEPDPTPAAPPPTEIPAPAPLEPDPGPGPAPSPAPTTAPLAHPGPSARADADRDAPVDTDRANAAHAAAERPISVAPLLGVASNGLRFGAGVRAGYTLPSNVYLGAGFMYHFGNSTEAFGVEVSSSAFYPSAEAGYDIRFGRMVVRPYGGLAVVFSHVSSNAAGLGEVAMNSTSGGIYPGCAFTYDVPKSAVFVGGDARVLFVFDGGSSFGAFGSAGMRF